MSQDVPQGLGELTPVEIWPPHLASTEMQGRSSKQELQAGHDGSYIRIVILRPAYSPFRSSIGGVGHPKYGYYGNDDAMKRDLVDILACPICKGDLELHVQQENEGEIEKGDLECRKCSIRYPIEDSIPNMLPPNER